MKYLSFVVLAASLLSACSFGTDTKAAEEGVTQFHAELNSSRFDDIYSATDVEFRAASTREDFTKLLAAIHTKLGNYQSGDTVGWNDNVNTGGHYVTLNRKAQFERGAAEEEFIFKVADDRTLMVGYHISSNSLITG